MLQSFKQFFIQRRAAIAAAGCLVLGCGLGAAAALETRPPAVMAPVAPVKIGSLAGMRDLWFSDEIVSLRGKVEQVYGGNFVLNDGSGTLLVQAGPRGEALVSPGQTVTVQGRAEPGVMRAAFVVGADGRVRALHPGRHGGRDGHGPGRRHGGEDRPMPRGDAFERPDPRLALPAPDAEGERQ